jgi:hypothetical protein
MTYERCLATSCPIQIGERISQTRRGQTETAIVVTVATEEEFLNVHPEWRDPSFNGLRFDHYYWLELLN